MVRTRFYERGYITHKVTRPELRRQLAVALCGIRKALQKERARSFKLSGMISYYEGLADGYRRAAWLFQEML
jgi:hypothetical protein